MVGYGNKLRTLPSCYNLVIDQFTKLSLVVEGMGLRIRAKHNWMMWVLRIQVSNNSFIHSLPSLFSFSTLPHTFFFYHAIQKAAFAPLVLLFTFSCPLGNSNSRWHPFYMKHTFWLSTDERLLPTVCIQMHFTKNKIVWKLKKIHRINPRSPHFLNFYELIIHWMNIHLVFSFK